MPRIASPLNAKFNALLSFMGGNCGSTWMRSVERTIQPTRTMSPSMLVSAPQSAPIRRGPDVVMVLAMPGMNCPSFNSIYRSIGDLALIGEGGEPSLTVGVLKELRNRDRKG